MKDPDAPPPDDPDAWDDHWSAWDEWGSDHPKEHSRTKARARLKAKDPEAEALAAAQAGEVRRGLVLTVGSKVCDVRVGDEVIACAVTAELAKNQQAELAVGDEVEVTSRTDGADQVSAVLPRRSELSRPDPLNPRKQRVLAANVDLVVATVSVVAPPLKPGLVDRVALACARGRVGLAVFVNKLDLLAEADPEVRAQEADALAALAVHEGHGVAVVRGSAETGDGVPALRALVAGKTVVFVGHSGVGKSSLLNALLPELELLVGEVRERDGMGRHTTTQAAVHFLADGTRLIDTPGVRQFGLWDLSPRELSELFPEFRDPELACRFGDCTHVHEPGCGVLEARTTGRLAEARYQVYRELLASLGESPTGRGPAG